MGTIQQEIAAIAAGQGYDGPAPTTIAEAVNALGSVMGGGGGGGGAEPLFVHFTYQSYDPETYTADKTFEEIAEAVANERLVIGVIGTTLDRAFYQLTSLQNIEEEGQYFAFSQVTTVGDRLRCRSINGSYYEGTLTITGGVKWVSFAS